MDQTMKNAADFGFSPKNDAVGNTLALQNAVKGGGNIAVSTVGIYDICGTVLLDSHTTLRFGDGVTLRRVAPEEGACAYLFINRGAYSRTENTDITIENLHLLCNGNEAMGSVSGLPEREDGRENLCDHIEGLRGHLSFFHCSRVTIRGFHCPDLGKTSYAVQVCAFRDFLFENGTVMGKKDGVHLGRGRGFVIRHCRFCTFDDPIAINAYDYTTGNPEVGFIEDGEIEDCYDLNDDTTTGYFCRILGGAWRDFESGMIIRHSDTVVSNGRIYRALMKPDGSEYRAVTPPTHERGKAVHEGICWVMCQEGTHHNCGCRNIHFRDIHLQKTRRVAFSVHFDNDAYCHGCYPHSELPENDAITLERIYVEGQVQMLVHANAPIRRLTVKDSSIADAKLAFCTLSDVEGLVYGNTELTLSDVTSSEGDGKVKVVCMGERTVLCKSNRPLCTEGSIMVIFAQNDR